MAFIEGDIGTTKQWQCDDCGKDTLHSVLETERRECGHDHCLLLMCLECGDTGYIYSEDCDCDDWDDDFDYDDDEEMYP
jgi:hypothetical protein